MVLSDADVEWCEALQKSIWKVHPRTSNSYGWMEDIRELTNDELDRIKKIASCQGVIVTLGSGVMGFGYSMAISQCSPYPEIPPTHLLTICCKHLPIKDRKLQRDTAWDMFSSLALVPSNIDRVKWHGLEAPRNDAAHYDY